MEENREPAARCSHEEFTEFDGAATCDHCGERLCANRLYSNEPGCNLPYGHEGWHSDSWQSWLTDADDEIIGRRGFMGEPIPVRASEGTENP